ncbi:MAG: hypothetical protein ACXWLV_08785, partial [Rhizomicrobium sp.]
MKKAILTVLVGLVLTFTSLWPVFAAASKARAVARLSARDGQQVGTANFIATSHGVLIEFDIKGLTPGPH